MPQIKPITSTVDQLHPTERGIDANLQAARRTGAFYNQAGEAISSAARARADAAGDIAKSAGNIANAVDLAVVQNEERAGHREIAAGSAAGAQLFSNLTDQWDNAVKAQAAKDPNDTSVAAQFRDQTLEPALDKFREAFGNTDKGQAWAEAHIARMRDHFYQKTSADMATLAGDAVRTNITNLGNASSNAAFKSPDFHTVDYLLQSTPDSIGAIVDSSSVKGTFAAQARTQLTEKAKEQIVKAAAAGAIAKSPDPEKTARDFADRYPEYMNGPEAAQFAKAAKTQAKSNTLADKQIEVYQRQKNEHAAQQRASKVFANNVSIDPVTSRPVIDPKFFNQAIDIARMPDAPPTLARTLLDWGEHQQNAKAQPTISDPVIKSALYQGLFDPTKPTTEVDLMRANIEGKLAPHDFAAMHQLQKALDETPLKGEVMKDTMAAVKASLTYTMPGLPGKDPKGLQNYSSFVQSFVPQYLAASRAGTLQPNALDTRDPKSMISQAMAPFRRTTKQLIDDRVQEMSTFGSSNLTGDNKTITGISVTNAEPIPAAPQREKNKVYELPKGPFKWDGSGWVKP
jgi:hypothetical protein